MNITRKGFEGVVANAFAGLGFPPEAPQAEFSEENFVSGSYLTSFERNMDKIIDGLMRWEPKIGKNGEKSLSKITVEGTDYQDAFIKIDNLFAKKLWGDGLPIIPPTKERVDWILTGTDEPPQKVFGMILPRGAAATVESLAVNLAMAGGRPEYLPLLIAAMEAILEPASRHRWWNTTTGDTYPVIIVNGPIAGQIRLASGYGCLGPSPVHRAGGIIGRAIRLLLLNVGGAVPGTGSMALYGGASRYTNVVFAEDEEGLPPGWKPLNVERGFSEGSNTVTVHTVSIAGTLHTAETGTENEALETLENWASFLRLPNYSYWSNTFSPRGTPAILLIPRNAALGLARQGWSKEKVKAFLWERSKVPETPLVRRWIEQHVQEGKVPIERVVFPMPIAMNPQNIMIVVAGGEQSGHAYFMSVGLSGDVIGKEIRLPTNWNDLLDRAEKDLGRIPLG